MTDERALPVSRAGLLALFLCAAVVSLTAFWVLAAAGSTTASLLVTALGLPLLVVIVPLFYIGSKVASRADDPDEVEARLAEGLGLTKAELDRRREDEGQYAHPAERGFDADEER